MADKYTVIDYTRQTPTLITEDHYEDVGPSFTLGACKRAFLGTGFQLRTSPGGATLTRDTDYELNEVDVLYSGAQFEDEPVYTVVTILDPAYETGDLYVTYNAVATYVTHAANILHSKLYSKEIGEMFAVSGNIKAPVEFSDTNPEAAFFGLCLDDIADGEVHDISADNFPDLVQWARAQKAVYLEGQTGEADEFAGSAAGSVITLSDNTANNAMLKALLDDAKAHGGGVETASYTDWRSVDWGGVTYPITAIDTTARTITVTGTPTAGAGNASFYPHRTSGSTTTARLFSMQDRELSGAGTSELVSGLRKRDQMQLITGEANRIGTRLFRDFEGAFESSVEQSGIFDGGTTGLSVQLLFNSSDSPDARTSATTEGRTHGPRMGVHIYIHAGRYVA